MLVTVVGDHGHQLFMRVSRRAALEALKAAERLDAIDQFEIRVIDEVAWIDRASVGSTVEVTS